MYDVLLKNCQSYRLNREIVDYIKGAILDLHLQITKRSLDLKYVIDDSDLSDFKMSILTKNEAIFLISSEDALKQVVQNIPFKEKGAYPKGIEIVFLLKYLYEKNTKNLLNPVNPFYTTENTLISSLEFEFIKYCREIDLIRETTQHVAVYCEALTNIFRRRIQMNADKINKTDFFSGDTRFSTEEVMKAPLNDKIFSNKYPKLQSKRVLVVLLNFISGGLYDSYEIESLNSLKRNDDVKSFAASLSVFISDISK